MRFSAMRPRAFLMAVDGRIKVNGWCAHPGERVPGRGRTSVRLPGLPGARYTRYTVQ